MADNYIVYVNHLKSLNDLSAPSCAKNIDLLQNLVSMLIVLVRVQMGCHILHVTIEKTGGFVTFNRLLNSI